MSDYQDNSNELNQLMNINEELLRSKGKLLQEIVSLKKQLVAQERTLALVEQLQKQVNGLNAEIVDHLLNRSVMSAKIDELESQLAHLKAEKASIAAELERMKQIKWYQRLLRRR